VEHKWKKTAKELAKSDQGTGGGGKREALFNSIVEWDEKEEF
jgi:hypothetical protein